MIKPIRSLAYGPGNLLAVGDFNQVRVWPPGKEQVHCELNWPEGEIAALQFWPANPDSGAPVLMLARGREVGLWRLEGNSARRWKTLRHQELVRAALFTADGRRLLTAGDDWTVHIWDTGSWQRQEQFNWRIGPVRALAVAPDGMTAAVVGQNRPGPLIWDLE
jgi:WD40 repeat protein